MKYSAVIRTLGTAGEKYQKELDSLCNQTIKPTEILVYIAEGYPIPKETCGIERYIYVKKGMVAQRALNYDEVTTDWILFLDDDVYLPNDGVEKLYKSLKKNGADVISPNTFENHKMFGKTKFLNILIGKAIPFKSDNWIYRILPSGGFKYNTAPTKDFYWSETNAGPCFLCKKKDFLSIHFEQELWLDNTPYALPEDQVMFYKMHQSGLKVGTSINSGIIHLDAGTAVQQSSDRLEKTLYSEIKNLIIFWHKFIKPHTHGVKRLYATTALLYSIFMRKILAIRSRLNDNKTTLRIINKAIVDANSYLKTINL